MNFPKSVRISTALTPLSESCSCCVCRWRSRLAKTKAQSDDKIYKPDREAEIVEKRSAGMEEELQLKYVSLLQSMIRASR